METIKVEKDEGMMESCPTGAQSSSSMARPAVLHSLLQMYLPLGGTPQNNWKANTIEIIQAHIFITFIAPSGKGTENIYLKRICNTNS